MIYVIDEIDSYFTTIKQLATTNSFRLFKTIDNWIFTGTNVELYVTIYDEDSSAPATKVLVKTKSSSGVVETTKGYKELKREYKRKIGFGIFKRK